MNKCKQSVKSYTNCKIRGVEILAAGHRRSATRKASNSRRSVPGLAHENELLLRESRKIVEALGKMFAPCCEVVLHDLRKPENSIIAIENPLSGRKIGQAVTEMGLARAKDPLFPDIVQNYSNVFPDGRPVKSTSIGIRNRSRGNL